MILNVSGRTDIVAFYMDWFEKRWKIGYFDVENPFYPKNVSRIMVKDIDMIVFCTKDPGPLLKYIDLFDVPVYLMVTITGYHHDIELNVKDKHLIISRFRELSDIIGKFNCALRYDPIILNDHYDIYYHIRAFDKLCNLLEGAIDRVIVSFVDDYKNVRSNKLIYHDPTIEELSVLGNALSNIACKHGMDVIACNEQYDLGFSKGCCVDIKMAFERTGKVFKRWNARDCGCAEMVDIGAYNSCLHGCKYCYANFDSKQILSNYHAHDDESSLLIGHISDQIVKVRTK